MKVPTFSFFRPKDEPPAATHTALIQTVDPNKFAGRSDVHFLFLAVKFSAPHNPTISIGSVLVITTDTDMVNSVIIDRIILPSNWTVKEIAPRPQILRWREFNDMVKRFPKSVLDLTTDPNSRVYAVNL